MNPSLQNKTAWWLCFLLLCCTQIWNSVPLAVHHSHSLLPSKLVLKHSSSNCTLTTNSFSAAHILNFLSFNLHHSFSLPAIKTSLKNSFSNQYSFFFGVLLNHVCVVGTVCAHDPMHVCVHVCICAYACFTMEKYVCCFVCVCVFIHLMFFGNKLQCTLGVWKCFVNSRILLLLPDLVQTVYTDNNWLTVSRHSTEFKKYYIPSCR